MHHMCHATLHGMQTCWLDAPHMLSEPTGTSPAVCLQVPTTLAPTQGSTVVEQTLTVDGRGYKMTCVSMGNPHAVTYSVDGKPIKVGGLGTEGLLGYECMYL